MTPLHGPEVAARLARARIYWLTGTSPTGAPHAVPAWGVVIAETLYLHGQRRTVKALDCSPARHDNGGTR